MKYFEIWNWNLDMRLNLSLIWKVFWSVFKKCSGSPCYLMVVSGGSFSLGHLYLHTSKLSSESHKLQNFQSREILVALWTESLFRLASIFFKQLWCCLSQHILFFSETPLKTSLLHIGFLMNQFYSAKYYLFRSVPI